MRFSHQYFDWGRFLNPSISVFQYSHIEDYKFESLTSGHNSWGGICLLADAYSRNLCVLIPQGAAGSCSPSSSHGEANTALLTIGM